jgi:hypothetical protein
VTGPSSRADGARLAELIAFLIHPLRVSARAARPFKRLQPLEEFAGEPYGIEDPRLYLFWPGRHQA